LAQGVCLLGASAPRGARSRMATERGRRRLNPGGLAFFVGLVALALALAAVVVSAAVAPSRGFAETAQLRRPPRGSGPEGSPKPGSKHSSLPEPGGYSTAEAWLRAARCVASGRPGTVAQLEAAWHGTEAWWLRPAAYFMAVGLGLVVGLQHRAGAAKAALFEIAAKGCGEAKDVQATSLSAKQGASAVRALQHLELPFFATSASWVDRPTSGLQVRGNVRPGALKSWSQEAVGLVRASLEAELGQKVVVHLLRADDRGMSTGEMTYELLVTDVPSVTPDIRSYAISLVSLVVAGSCSVLLGSSSALQAAGSVVAPGSALPFGALAALLGVSEAARRGVAQQLGVETTLPTFLPSPQLGLLGIFSTAQTPCPSRASALALALAAPLALALSSGLLLIYGLLVGSGSEVVLQSSSHLAWPLAMLPPHCDALAFAGVQGLLMASLSLLPSSPAGQVVWQSLHGAAATVRISDAVSFLYPIAGLVSMYYNGSSWMILPFWWAFLLINASPMPAPPPTEEVSDVPTFIGLSAYCALAAAGLCLIPWPMNEVARTVFPALGLHMTM